MATGSSHPVALLRLGFRPFYLLAGIFAVISVPAWMGLYFGWLESPARMRGLFWHAHEMLFGFVAAVISGFLLTAVPNWTGKATLTGYPLAVLALVWFFGRLVLWFDEILNANLNIAVDCAFLFLLAVILAWPVWRTRNYRNFGVIGIVLLIASANLMFHLVVTGGINISPIQVLNTALDAFILMIVVIGGRVIPFFTANALPESGARRVPIEDGLAIASVILLLIADGMVRTQPLTPYLAILAGVINAWRMRAWRPLATLKHPILWILNLGYAWIIIGLIFKGLSAEFAWVPRQAFVHAITTGAIGSMTLGMMTRTALGHSGRPLILPAPIAWCYGLVNLAAVIRVGGTWGMSSIQQWSLILSTVAWCFSYGIFVNTYWPILTRPRVDGRPG